AFFFSSRRRHTRSDRDWSSDVCSSDLYTLTISNQGPNTAQNVVLAQMLPANSSFISTTSTSGTNSPSSGGLVSSPLIIPAGGARSEERRVGKECRGRWRRRH